MVIQFGNLYVSFGGATLKTRSKELIRFVGYLAWKFKAKGVSEWVGLEELSGVIGTAHPKQFQRYIDTLTSSGLHLIEFKTKTGGPWRLSGTIKSVSFDLSEAELDRLFLKPTSTASSIYFNDELFFDITQKLTNADLHFHNGQLDESISLANAILFNQISGDVDVELQVLICLRIARACGRATMFEEALSALDTATDLLKRQSMSFHELNMKVLIAKAKIFFDRGNLLQALAILDSLPIHECRDAHTLAQYHNLAGLFIHRRLRLEIESGKIISNEMLKEWLETCRAHYQRSLVSHLFLNDYHAVQATCFNLGNLFAFIIKKCPLLENKNHLEQAIQWLTLSEVICNKQGVGGESVWALLLLVDTGVSNNIPLLKLKTMTSNLFHSFGSYLDIARWIHEEAKNIGNRLEIAESLQLMAKLSAMEGNIENAVRDATKSLDLFTDLGRKDMASTLKKLLAEISSCPQRITQ